MTKYDIELFIKHQTQNSKNLVDSLSKQELSENEHPDVANMVHWLKEQIKGHRSYAEHVP